MKKLLIIALSLITLSACKDDYSYYKEEGWTPSFNAHFLNTGVSSLYFEADGETQEFEVRAINSPWKIENPAEWLAFSPNTGSSTQMVSATAQPNDLATSRTAICLLKSNLTEWSYSHEFAVTQYQTAPYVELDTTYVSFPGGGGSDKIGIKANGPVEFTDVASWYNVTCEEGTDYITVTAYENIDSYTRSDYFYVKNGSAQVEVYVKQAVANVSVSQNILEFSNDAGECELEIESEIGWNLSRFSSSWIQVTPNEGTAGKTKITVSVSPNQSISKRSGDLYFNRGTSSERGATIAVYQDGLNLSIPSSLTASSTGGKLTIEVTSNTEWQITEAPAWCSITPASGKGNATLSIEVADNPSLDSRTGRIVVKVPGVSLSDYLTLTQEGKHFTTSKTYLQLGADASTAKFDIDTDAPWTSSWTQDWFAATPTSGTGNATISVTASANNNPESRSDVITYAYFDKEYGVEVNQQGRYFILDNSNVLDFSSLGGSHEIDFSSNDTWTAKVDNDVDWITLSQTSGTGNGIIKLTVAENPSVNVRSTTVTITPSGSREVLVLVSQQPRKLEVSARSIAMFAAGGTSQPVNVITDGKYSVSTTDTWFTINNDAENSCFTITAQKNETKELRRGEITVKLTDLKEGSLELTISVLQAAEGCTFVLTPYPKDDTDWTPETIAGFTITRTGFTEDKNWSAKFGSLFKVTVTGYSSDQDWNRKLSFASKITVNPYKPEQNWNPKLFQNTKITITNFSSDQNWNN